MQFELSVNSTTEVESGAITALITKQELFIKREEIIEYKENDANRYCQTLRSMIYMYHYSHGYVTQMTDDTMYEIYNHLMDHPESVGVIFQVIQKEMIVEEADLDSETISRRAQSVQLDMFFV